MITNKKVQELTSIAGRTSNSKQCTGTLKINFRNFYQTKDNSCSVV